MRGLRDTETRILGGNEKGPPRGQGKGPTRCVLQGCVYNENRRDEIDHCGGFVRAEPGSGMRQTRLKVFCL